MHNRPPIKKFEFKDEAKFLRKINSLDISLVEQEQLIDKIHERYPVLNKYQISLIIKTTIIYMRKLLIFGNVLDFKAMLNRFRFEFGKDNKHKKTILQAIINTPQWLKKHD